MKEKEELNNNAVFLTTILMNLLINLSNYE